MVKIKKLLSFLLVALFVSYYANIALFSHSHIISGATIFHSHFHTESHHDTKSGDHTEQSITLIAQLSQIEYVDFSCNYLLKPSVLPLYINNCVEPAHRVISTYLENTSLRAPPIV